MSVRRFVLLGGAVLGLRGGVTLLNGVAGLLLARYLGEVEFGRLSVVLSFFSFFQLASLFGLDAIVVREIARDPARQNPILGNAIGLRFALGLAAFGGANVTARLVGYPPEIERMLMLTSFCLFFGVGGLVADAFQARRLLLLQSVGEFAAAVLMLAVNLVLLRAAAGLEWFAVVAAAAPGFQALCFLPFLRRIPGLALSLGQDRGRWGALLGASWPLLVFALAVQVNLRFDQLYLFHHVSPADLGTYAAMVKLREAINFIPVVWVGIVYPVLSRDHQARPDRFEPLATLSFRLLAAVVMPIVGVATLCPVAVTRLAFGARYLAGAAWLQAVIWVCVFGFLGSVLVAALNASGRQKTAMRLAVTATVLHVALNLLLVPRYGVWGAIAAMLASASGGGGLLYLASSGARSLALAYGRALVRPVLAAVLAGGLAMIAVSPDAAASGPIVSGRTAAAIGGFLLAYGAILVLTGGIARRDLDALRDLATTYAGRVESLEPVGGPAAADDGPPPDEKGLHG